MAAVLIIMFIVSALVAASISGALSTNSSSRRDANAKAALQAAQAGLGVAAYRLNMLQPDASHCVGSAVGSPASGYCQSGSESMGNGASYVYYMTPALASGSTCVGLALSAPMALTQRCITAIGTANGVSERAQIRVAAFAAVPLFPYTGIVGLNGVTIANNAFIDGYVASNKVITESNNATMTGYVLGPAGSISVSNNATPGTATKLTPQQGPIVLQSVDPGNSATTNSNFRISNYLANPSNPTTPYDKAIGVTYNPATRVLTAINNASLTLGGGVYNFCSMTLANNVTITTAATTKTQIFIDSPDDPNSGCAAGTGTISSANNVTWSNPSNDATALQIYVYGLRNGTNVVNFANNGNFYGLIYAPLSAVNLTNNGAFYGGLAGASIALLNNLAFHWAGNLSTLQSRLDGLYSQTAWAQCTAAPTTSDQGSGCG